MSLVSAFGQATLVNGTKTVDTTGVKTASTILLSRKTGIGTIGDLSVGTIVDKTSFVISSANILDTSVVNWVIID